ncbi:MAG: ABC transporter ATP-binding protein [Hyphomicrobiaceae bacterium]
MEQTAYARAQTSALFSSDNHNLWRLGYELAESHPLRTASLVVASVAAGVLEGIGIIALLPLLALADPAASASSAGRLLEQMLAQLGLQPDFPTLLSIIVASIAMKGLAMIWVAKETARAVGVVTSDLRRRLIAALMAARWRFFATRPVGDLANLMTLEVERAGRAYEGVCRALAYAIQATIYLSLAFLVTWQIALAALIGGGMLGLCLRRLICTAQEAGRRQTALSSAIAAELADGLRGIKPLKAMAREAGLAQILGRAVESLNIAVIRATWSRHALTALAEPVIAISIAVGLYVAHRFWAIPPTTLIVMAAIYFRILTRVASMHQEWQSAITWQAALDALRRSLHLAEADKEPVRHGAIPQLPAAIELRGVSLAYGKVNVLHDLCLILKAGRVTTIVGASGAGKSSIADLIAGLIVPNDGSIVIGGLDLSTIDLAQWRRAIGYVPQEPFLFNDTLRSNVVLGDTALTDQEVIAAVVAAGAPELVDGRCANLDSHVGEAGALLSGGQRQRIALARALIRRPSLLVLDEPTSALDPATEKAICETVRSLANQATVLVMTHRIAWLDVSHAIYKLAGGGISLIGDGVEKSVDVTRDDGAPTLRRAIV